MNTILKILAVSVLFALFSTTVQARNEYLNDGTNTCDQGSWEAYTEVRQNEYKSGNHDEYQNQTIGWRFRKSIGDACSDEFIAEQQLKQKLKTQLELVKECKRVPRISPPPVEFAELINMCMKLGIMSTASFEDRPDDSISYWTVLKEDWKKENPDKPIFESK
tara:strand:- start:116 stop:604 length:489 start_codon:yes stop_codon:yes gene_type:complete